MQMAQYIGKGQWTLLHQQGVPNVNEIHVCKPHTKLSPLSSEQWTCREISRNHQKSIPQSQRGRPTPYTALMVYRNTPLNGSLQSPMQILQGRQAHTDLPLLHAEILHVQDKSLSTPTHDIPIGQHVMYREPHDGR